VYTSCMNKPQSSEFYTPGVCNINVKEVAYRRKAGKIVSAFGVAVLMVLLLTSAPYFLGLLVFIPAVLAALSFLQAKNNFCVQYAAAGKYNGSDQYAKTEQVSNEADKKRDAIKSRQIYLQSVGIGVVCTVLSLIILAAR